MADKRDDERPPTTVRLTESQIIANTVGERKPSNTMIYLAPYDERWPLQFEQLAGLVREALGDRVRLLEHIGSTSVPGLAAKPKIDIVLVVADTTDEAAYVAPLEAHGFTLRIREPDWYQHRLLITPGVVGNLHVFSDGCVEVERMLRFRDRLRAHEDDRQLYEDTKRDLAGQVWKYTQNYADAKSGVMGAILARADRAWGDG